MERSSRWTYRDSSCLCDKNNSQFLKAIEKEEAEGNQTMRIVGSVRAYLERGTAYIEKIGSVETTSHSHKPIKAL
jgi:hypothetical protein